MYCHSNESFFTRGFFRRRLLCGGLLRSGLGLGIDHRQCALNQGMAFKAFASFPFMNLGDTGNQLPDCRRSMGAFTPARECRAPRPLATEKARVCAAHGGGKHGHARCGVCGPSPGLPSLCCVLFGPRASSAHPVRSHVLPCLHVRP